MLKWVLLFLAILAVAVPAQAKILLGNHHISFDFVGTTQYFEFADFLEWEFPEQDLNWGFTSYDLNPEVNDDPGAWDPDIADWEKQNRNLIKMRFQGNLDLGLRLRSALDPDLGVEAYLKYTPADLVISYNGVNMAAANFARYAGVTNPNDPPIYLNWVDGDYPTYHIFRWGLNLDYVYLRTKDNEFNLYVSGGIGAISYHCSGKLLVPVDFDEETQDYPSAPRDISYILPNDTFPSASIGIGGLFFVHRYFGMNFDIRGNYTSFEFKRAGFESQGHWVFGASIGYSIRL